MTTSTGETGHPVHTRPRPRRVVALVLVAALILAGVFVALWQGGGEEAPAAITTEAPAAPPALAETAGEEGTLKIEVTSLVRTSPQTLELRMAVTNVGEGQTALDIAQRFSADDPDRGTIAEVYLADVWHQRKLFVLRNAEGEPVGSRDERPLGPGERREVWAQYPAPAEADTEVVVHVPHAEPMPNIVITSPAARE